MAGPFKNMKLTADEILKQLLTAKRQHTGLAPKESRGVYGLVDHLGDLRYIGSTSVPNETFHKRIHHRHRTGSETHSHYFSRMYNTGRMWRLRNDPKTKSDGDIAKKLRNEFIAEYCRAVWVPLSDNINISALESEVIRLAPPDTIAWNRRGMDAYEEPTDLVDIIIDRLGFGASERAALDRQKERFLATSSKATAYSPIVLSSIPPFPRGDFRFVALDVETANNDRGSICQIGVACVRPDNTIETWRTYVDPQTDRWVFSDLHGITKATVAGAPKFSDVLCVLQDALDGLTVYQHSGFDRSAIRSACQTIGCAEPDWDWQDSVGVARRAWPELRGNGGHGLASLKAHLGLSFHHHDAGEDARAAAEVVLHAESVAGGISSVVRQQKKNEGAVKVSAHKPGQQAEVSGSPPGRELGTNSKQLLGQVQLTSGNIRNSHIYLRDLWQLFPSECIGGSNAASAATRTIRVDWGGPSVEITDLDGSKKIFRKRSWVRKFFEIHGVREGDCVCFHAEGPYEYRVSIQRS